MNNGVSMSLTGSAAPVPLSCPGAAVDSRSAIGFFALASMQSALAPDVPLAAVAGTRRAITPRSNSFVPNIRRPNSRRHCRPCPRPKSRSYSAIDADCSHCAARPSKNRWTASRTLPSSSPVTESAAASANIIPIIWDINEDTLTVPDPARSLSAPGPSPLRRLAPDPVPVSAAPRSPRPANNRRPVRVPGLSISPARPPQAPRCVRR